MVKITLSHFSMNKRPKNHKPDKLGLKIYLSYRSTYHFTELSCNKSVYFLFRNHIMSTYNHTSSNNMFIKLYQNK